MVHDRRGSSITARNDAARRKQLIDQVRTYRETIFAREIQQTVLKPLIDKMEALLVDLGVFNVVSEIAIVRQQLRLAESAGAAISRPTVSFLPALA